MKTRPYLSWTRHEVEAERRYPNDDFNWLKLDILDAIADHEYEKTKKQYHQEVMIKISAERYLAQYAFHRSTII